MFSGSAVLILAAAQAAAAPTSGVPYGPSLPPKPRPVAKVPPETCAPPANPGEVVVCAIRPQGYRLDPDLLEAQRLKRQGSRPKPRETFADNSCASVGPMGCTGGGGVNLLAAAIAAGTMAAKAVKGENVGKMFITDPQPDEYQLYVEAKRRREEREAEEAALARAKAAAGPAGAEAEE